MNSNYLLLSENYMEIIHPLIKWRILPLDRIVSEMEYSGKMSNFYKKVTKLEKSGLIGSFLNPTTKRKEIFLQEPAFRALGEMNVNTISNENRLHESVTSQILFHLSRSKNIKNVMMEHEYISLYPSISSRPDAVITAMLDKDITLAIECELTQKSAKRVIEKYKFYNRNQYFNNVIYVFPLARIYNSYISILKNLADEIQFERFIFLYTPNLYDKNLDLFNVEATHRFNKTTLNDLFSKGGRT